MRKIECFRKNSRHLRLGYTLDPCVFVQRLNLPGLTSKLHDSFSFLCCFVAG